MTDKAPDTPPPSWSTDPTPRNSERADDGLLRAAANLATVVIGGEVGEQVRLMMWTYYNTPKTRVVRELAKAILAEAEQRRASR